jgi:alpha-beta hydrolase superfamily lysophospholipase
MRPPCRVHVIISAVFLAVFVTQAWGIEQRVQLRTTTGTLHGTLDLPVGTFPCPVMVIIAGSGPTDRDGNQPLMKNDSLKLLGQALAVRGIAVLRYDKRGVAESTAAAAREEDLRFETYVGDVVQWVTWLRRDPRFMRVGLIGHSEGSLIGMLAAKQAKVDAFVSLAGSGRAAPALIREQLDAKLATSLKAQNSQILDELVAGRTVMEIPEELTALYRPSVQPYLISWFKYDPVREIAALEVPVLIVQGTTDLQISIEDAKRLAAAKKNAKLRLIDGMNHVLKHATLPAEQQAAYTDPSLPIKAQAVEEITAFLTTEIANAATRPNPAMETDANRRPGSSPRR